MNPRLLLALWRERWGKADGKNLATPFIQGPINRWSNRLTHLSVWSLPGVTAFVVGICLIIFALMLSVQFSLDGQWIFSGILIVLALYLHRYAGTFVTLVLLGLTILVSARYLSWRIGTTLPRDLGLAFAVGFSLCVAEAHLWLLIILRCIETVWPLKQAEMPLPIETGAWPTVDVFIACDDQPLATITSVADAVQALDWPKNRLKILILDAFQRDDVQALADSLGAAYLVQAGNLNDKASSLNQAFGKTSGELIAILECDRSPAPDLLKMTAGWFVHDLKLGMVQTHRHFLAPPASLRVLSLFDKPELSGSCSLMRRSVLMEVGGIDSDLATKHRHTALKMQATGYNTAYFSLTARESRSRRGPTTSFQQHAEPLVAARQVDRPFGDRSLLLRMRLNYLKDMLAFYDLFPRLAFFVAPLAYLLLDLPIIDTSAPLLFAYVLPLLLHGYITRRRVEQNDRFTLLPNIREMALACYMALLTTLTVIQAELASWLDAMKARIDERNTAFDWKIALPAAVAIGLNLTALIIGIRRLPTLDSNAQGLAVLFIMWTIYNMTIRAASLAVTEESRAIRRHVHLQFQIPAMLKLPSGRTVSCMTENFPDIALALKLPAPVSLEDGETINISVFHSNREFSFPAQVDLEPNLILRAHIDGTAQNIYRALGVAAYSRGQNWPKWLPGRDADHLYPSWLPQTYASLRSAIGDFGFGIGKFVRGLRTSSGMQTWKKK